LPSKCLVWRKSCRRKVYFPRLYLVDRNRHFLYLPYERLLSILKRPELCADELDVFLAIVSWVDAQRDDRQPVAPSLLRLVRFQLIPPDILAREVQAIDWLFNNHECMEPVWEAYKCVLLDIIVVIIGIFYSFKK